ncbi:MAG TPA: hypothetical protein VFZ08_16695 [Terriglobia bacterium]|nr:hypothetical protein [Terriglobia bacterium]
MRKTLTLALVAAAFILTPLALRADSLQETFSLTLPSTVLNNTAVEGGENFSTTSFAEFNPALGTLNSINVTFTGSATFSGSSLLSSALLFHNSNETVGPLLFFSSPGAINFNMAAGDGFRPDLARITGTGTTVFDLNLDAPGATFATTSPGGLAGKITYDYSPPAPTPAPESSTMVQLVPTLLGMLAFGWWLERRKCSAISR